MKIGVFTGDVIGRGGIERIRTEANHATEDGLDSFWLPNIFGLDGLTALAMIAPEVPGIELGGVWCRCRHVTPWRSPSRPSLFSSRPAGGSTSVSVFHTRS
ncbi:MAG: LLM class flavin-dependent oxidoreductase [Microthrixaceae bacterium]|nr:LLM class flavin-dependent oxidoreductase [Microthrixaceae bacterium]